MMSRLPGLPRRLEATVLIHTVFKPLSKLGDFRCFPSFLVIYLRRKGKSPQIIHLVKCKELTMEFRKFCINVKVTQIKRLTDFFISYFYCRLGVN